MKRLLCVLIVLLLPLTSVLAQDTAEDPSLLGVVYYPRGATEETASFAFRYRLPQLSPDHLQYDSINRYFASYAADIVETVIPATLETVGELPPAGEPEHYVNLDYRILSDTNDQISVVLISQQFLGNTMIEQWVSDVFALSGIYAGHPMSLSQAMGLEQEDAGEDAASELVYDLVWQIIAYETEAMQGAYFPDITQEEYRMAFSPQDDFYFDSDGNFVFFIQAGTIASEMEGVLTYPFSMAELLSALGQDKN